MEDETYVTSQGDTWDDLALEIYGDEAHAGYLMEVNYWCLDILVFSEGTVINAPPLPDDTEDADGYEEDEPYEEDDDIDPYDGYGEEDI